MLNGIINIYKEKAYTSHDVVARLRGILKQKKIGHTGTLDPDAEGVLPVCLGNATKLCELLTDKRKTYSAKMLLGKTTTTQDISGQLIQEREVLSSIDEIKDVIYSFIGEYNQIPPMYSALKVDGKKLVDLARKGIEVERKPRPITIYDIKIEDISLPEISIKVDCSKGTYIRTLCHDIGQRLSCGGCLKELTRIKVERFSIEEAIKLSYVEELVKDNKINEYILSIEDFFYNLNEIEVLEKYNKPALNGNRLYLYNIKGNSDFKQAQRVKVYTSERKFLGIYEYNASDKAFKPYRMFLEVNK